MEKIIGFIKSEYSSPLKKVLPFLLFYFLLTPVMIRSFESKLMLGMNLLVFIFIALLVVFTIRKQYATYINNQK